MRMDAAIKYRCEVRGYTYDPDAGDPMNGIAEKTPFEELVRIMVEADLEAQERSSGRRRDGSGAR